MRRFVTLIELLIALSLTAVLLTLLNMTFYQVDSWGQKVEKQVGESFKKRRVLNRFSEIFPRILENRFIYKKESGLLFDFDNGVQLDPLFSSLS